jgi:serine protease Do
MIARSSVFGIVLWLMSGSGFALESAEIHFFQPQIGYLGVRIRDVSQQDVEVLRLPAESGVHIQGVEDGSPAEAADLKKGDVILQYGGIPVLGVRQFRRLVSETPVGREVMLKIRRGTETLSLTTKIARRKVHSDWEGFGAPNLLMHRYRVPDTELEELPFHFRGPDFSINMRDVRLGVQAVTLTGQMADFLGISDTQGVLVLEVHPNTAADHAGIRAGDVIVSVDDHSIKGPAELRSNLSAGEHELEMVRNGSVRRVTVNLTARTSGDSVRM